MEGVLTLLVFAGVFYLMMRRSTVGPRIVSARESVSINSMPIRNGISSSWSPQRRRP